MSGPRLLNLLNSNHRRGAEAFALDLGRALSNLGLSVETAALTGATNAATHDIDVLGHGWTAPATALARLLNRSRSFDVLLGHGGRTLLSGALVSTLSRRPFAYRVIGEPLAWAGGERTLRRTRVGWALRHAEVIVGYVRSQTEVLHEQFDIDPSRLRVIPKGIDLSGFAPVSDEARRAARESFGIDGTDPSHPVVAYVGALTREKNVEQIIRSIERVGDVRLIVAGNGPHEPALRQLAEPSSSIVTFTGAVTDPRRVYAAADVLALTSRTEGVPTVVLEAGLMGLPVVATRVGGLPETVDDGVTGLLVDIDDDCATAEAIATAIQQKATLGAAARSFGVSRWDIQVVARQWRELVEELTNAAPPP